MRIDTLLHRLRFARTRGRAQAWIEKGHFRVNGQRVTGRDHRVAPGDVITLPLHSGVAVIEICQLPERRGPPAEARSCYRALDAHPASAIAGGMATGRSPPPAGRPEEGSA